MATVLPAGAAPRETQPGTMSKNAHAGVNGGYHNQVQPAELPDVQLPRDRADTEQGAAISVDIPADMAATTTTMAPPGRPVRSGTAILGRYNEHIHEHQHEDRLDPHPAGDHGAKFHNVAETLHIDQQHLDERRAHALQSAKDRGLATPQMIEHITAMPGVNPYAVSELPLSIQAGFRKKMLTLLFLQLSFSVALAFLVRYTPSLKEPLETAFPAQGAAALGLMVAVLFGLPVMSCVKDKHPWNLLFTLFWSVLLGVFLAASDLEGAFSRAHAFLMIMSMLTAGVFFLIIFTQIPWRDIEGAPCLMRFSYAGLASWLCWLIGGSIVFANVKDKVDWQEPADEEGEDFDPTPVFVTSTLVSTVVFSWFCYEAYKLCCKMSPDEYLKGVIYFYTDMFYVCACCALLACLGGGGNGGAPPKDEEER